LQTRVLVTHSVTHLPQVDFIIVLKNGIVSESGTYNELVEKKGDFAEFLATYLKEDNNEAADVDAGALTLRRNDSTRLSPPS
jgi:ATP-binding cassette subfamily C (CFTR/MRP) protein 1